MADDGREIVDPAGYGRDEDADRSLRPETFGDFVNQRQTVDNLKVAVSAAKLRREALDHVLLSGLPGLGKTTLAQILANEMDTAFVQTSGPALEKPADLVGILTNLGEGDVLFIDEIHRLRKNVQEHMYSAMEDYKIDIMLDQGPNARSLPIPLKPFTLVGATTRQGMLTNPFLSRFGILEKLDEYRPEDLRTILLRSAKILAVAVSDEAAEKISRAARGTPRIVNRLLRRLRDWATVEGDGVISLKIVEKGFRQMGIDDAGLTETDRTLLRKTIADYGGGPVGLNTLAVVLGEEPDTVENVIEPFLIREGFLIKTPSGRCVTESAYRFLGIAPNSRQREIF